MNANLGTHDDKVPEDNSECANRITQVEGYINLDQVVECQAVSEATKLIVVVDRFERLVQDLNRCFPDGPIITALDVLYQMDELVVKKCGVYKRICFTSC